MGKPLGKWLAGGLRYKWKNNFKTNYSKMVSKDKIQM